MDPIQWIHSTSYATAMRESQFLYPLLQGVHIVGLSMFAGAVGLVDLRVLGLGKSISLPDFAQHAMRVAWIGFGLILVSGLSMAVGFIDVFWVSTVLRLKLFALVFALINAAMIQHMLVGNNGARFSATLPTGPRMKALAATGIAVLLFIITLGKLLAYIGGKD